MDDNADKNRVESRSTGDAKVLIVDDIPANLDLIVSYLRGHGFTTLIARNGESALKRANYAHPDLILLDVMMPGIDGFETFRRLKLNEETKDIPVIFMTALSDPEHKVRAFSVGAVDYITKPVQKEEVLARVKTHIKIHKYREHLENEVQKRTIELEERMVTLENEIAERKRVEKQLNISEKKYRDIFENALEGIFQATLRGGFISANPAMATILGYKSAEELIGKVTDIGRQLFCDAKQFKELNSILKDKGMVEHYETRLKRMDKTTVWCALKIHSIRDENGQLSHLEGLITDITDNKQAEAHLLNAYREVEKRVEERTAALQSTNIQLQKTTIKAQAAAKAKSEFIANMSHEIRTPMNGVITAADLALGLNPDSKMERYLSIIKSSGHSLLGIINEILDFSKIEAGKIIFEKSPFQLSQLFENLGAMFGAKLIEMNKPIELIFDLQPEISQVIIGDEARLQQILINLLGNAVKFTEKGHIVMGAEIIDQDEPMVKLQFYVKDTGVGMEKTSMENLFEPFTQADASTTRKYGGTGLGMAISKQLVGVMEGDIWAESEPGKGSTFYFTVTMEYKSADALKFIVPDEIKDLWAIIADDCEEVSTVLTKYLTYLGFRVEQVSSGIELLNKIKLLNEFQEFSSSANMVGFVMVDWIMPGIDGIETIKKIRNELQMSCPIIMMSSFGDDLPEKKALNAGVDFFLNKPFHLHMLYEVIMHMFGFDHLLGVPPRIRDKNIDIIDHHLFFNRQILLVEDNLVNQEIAVAVLSQVNIMVDIANNGKEALTAIYKKDYDAVLMDMQMPEMDGYEATKLIRKDFRFNDLPIIAMTAHAMKGDEEKCLNAGMNGYIAKPINQKKLFNILGKFLKAENRSLVKTFRIEELQSMKMEMEDEIMAEPLPDDLPGIEIKKAKDSLKLSNDIFKNLLLIFLKSNKPVVEDIKNTFNNRDFKGLCKIAHSLKGSSANIGAIGLHDASKVVELAGKDLSDNLPNRKMVNDLLDELNLVLLSIETLSAPEKDIAAEKREKIHIGNVRRIILSLLNALDERELSKVKMFFLELMTQLGTRKTNLLDEYIGNYDYDAAIKELRNITDEFGIRI